MLLSCMFKPHSMLAPQPPACPRFKRCDQCKFLQTTLAGCFHPAQHAVWAHDNARAPWCVRACALRHGYFEWAPSAAGEGNQYLVRHPRLALVLRQRRIAILRATSQTSSQQLKPSLHCNPCWRAHSKRPRNIYQQQRLPSLSHACACQRRPHSSASPLPTIALLVLPDAVLMQRGARPRKLCGNLAGTSNNPRHRCGCRNLCWKEAAHLHSLHDFQALVSTLLGDLELALVVGPALLPQLVRPARPATSAALLTTCSSWSTTAASPQAWLAH